MFATAKARAVVPFLLLAWSCGSFAEDNLLRNPGFEEDLEGSWSCTNSRCVLDVSDDSYSGQRSVHVHTRTSNGWGVEQRVEGIKAGGLYILSAHFKLLTIAADDAMLELTVTLIGNGQSRVVFAKQPYIRPCDGWVKVTTDIVTNGDTNAMIVSMATNAMAPEFLVDDATLTELVPDPLWREKANERIAQIRMGTIQIRTKATKKKSTRNISIMINQTSSSFPFGAAVDTSTMTGNSTRDMLLQEYFFSMFNWATIRNNLKWRFMEPVEGTVLVDSVKDTLDLLESRGIQGIRGHCVVWGKSNKILKWLKNKSAQDIKYAVSRRIWYLVEEFGSRIASWDVNNERLRGSWYEEQTNNTAFTAGIHEALHQALPQTSLFLNDYSLVAHRLFTSAMRRQALAFMSQGVPVSAIGAQGHINTYPDVDLHKRRLDHLATAGLPIWITELDIKEEDVARRAQAYEDVIRLYFSHPAVAGIVLWSYWDGHYQTNTALVEGDLVQENEAGRRVRELMHGEWKTHVTVDLDDVISGNEKVRGFHGTYNFTVLEGQDPIYSGSFVLDKDSEAVIDVELRQD